MTVMAQSRPPDIFGEIKSRLSAEEVLSHFLGPARFRRWHCPFHHPDKNPSMTAKDGGIVCWGCAWKGDLFRFIEDYQSVSRAEALRIAADLAGVVLPERTTGVRRFRLPSLARSHAHVLREAAAIEKNISYQARKAAGLAWRTAWDAKETEKVWDAVEIGAALDKEVTLLEMEMSCGDGD